jgi:hypothetical protein
MTGANFFRARCSGVGSILLRPGVCVCARARVCVCVCVKNNIGRCVLQHQLEQIENKKFQQPQLY